MKFPKWHFIFNLFFCRRILTDSLLLSATDQVCGARFHMSVVLYLPFSLFLSLFFFLFFSLHDICFLVWNDVLACFVRGRRLPNPNL